MSKSPGASAAPRQTRLAAMAGSLRRYQVERRRHAEVRDEEHHQNVEDLEQRELPVALVSQAPSTQPSRLRLRTTIEKILFCVLKAQ